MHWVFYMGNWLIVNFTKQEGLVSYMVSPYKACIYLLQLNNTKQNNGDKAITLQLTQR